MGPTMTTSSSEWGETTSSGDTAETTSSVAGLAMTESGVDRGTTTSTAVTVWTAAAVGARVAVTTTRSYSARSNTVPGSESESAPSNGFAGHQPAGDSNAEQNTRGRRPDGPGSSVPATDIPGMPDTSSSSFPEMPAHIRHHKPARSGWDTYWRPFLYSPGPPVHTRPRGGRPQLKTDRQILETPFENNSDRNIVLITFIGQWALGTYRGDTDGERPEIRPRLRGSPPLARCGPGGTRCRPMSRTRTPPTRRP